METKIYFQADGLELEGRIYKGSIPCGVVLTHPHPLYGGDMHNIVVETLARAYREKGYSTLRFNFRGAGMSQGRFDEGCGEQADLQAAVSFLAEQQNQERIDVAGYSFGAWVAALAVPHIDAVHRLVMVAPPVAFVDFGVVGALPKLDLVVCGTEDDFAPHGMVKDCMPQWNPTAPLVTIEGGDHFFFSHASELKTIIARRIGKEE